MISNTTPAFWRCYNRLPQNIQLRAQKAYAMWLSDSKHPGLKFKRVSRSEPVYSVRISLNYRALGVLENNAMLWFWIGSHDDYERLLKG
ncbi:MAG: hypothetical protein COA85_12850 [Robiginitomaculum sp.]|nr:MAG: hypothetical protein COA85_12850 [Robiginitomaculum sp.]